MEEKLISFDPFLQKARQHFKAHGLRLLSGELVTTDGLLIHVQAHRRLPKELWDRYDIDIQLAHFIQQLENRALHTGSRAFRCDEEIAISEAFLRTRAPYDKVTFQPIESAYLLLTACPLGLRMENSLVTLSHKGFCGIEDFYPFRYVHDSAPHLQLCFTDYETFLLSAADKPSEILRFSLLDRLSSRMARMPGEAGQSLRPSAWQILLPRDVTRKIENRSPDCSGDWSCPILALCGGNIIATDGVAPARLMTKAEVSAFIQQTCFPNSLEQYNEDKTVILDSFMK